MKFKEFLLLETKKFKKGDVVYFSKSIDGIVHLRNQMGGYTAEKGDKVTIVQNDPHTDRIICLDVYATVSFKKSDFESSAVSKEEYNRIFLDDLTDKEE